MALVYEPPSDGPIRQAELLKSVAEFQPISKPNGDDDLEIRKVDHPLAVVISQDCDLEQDFDLRFPADGEPVERDAADMSHRSISHVILCDAYPEAELIRRLPDGFGSKDKRKIQQNQNERYHKLDAAPIAGDESKEVEELFFDFRRFFAIPSADIYDQLAAGTMERIACVPAYYLHDLSQRFFSYQSRVAIPD
jgi:hypothetical protein